MKLTQPMFDQLMEILNDHRKSGVYWGNKQQFDNRSKKIREWIRHQLLKQEEEKCQ
jgi:hypothetical protein